MKTKIKLDKYNTALLMCIKGHKIKFKNEYDINYEFKNDEKVLNSCRSLAYTYLDGRLLPLESFRIEYINKALLDIFEVVCPHKFKELIHEIVYIKTAYKNRSNKEILFLQLYGYLQALTMFDENGEDIFELDYELLKETNAK